MRLFFSLVFLAAPLLALSQDRSETDCLGSLEQAYSLFEVRPASAVRGDFNGDGRDDWASLMDRTASPPAKSAIGVCLSGEDRPLLIPSEHQLRGISLTVRGARHTDLITDMTGLFERDAISVRDEAGNSWNYILRAGTFKRIGSRD